MTKILIFCDSLCHRLPVKSTSQFQYHIESFPGRTVESVIQSEQLKDTNSLSFSLSEDNYDLVIICFGVNDLGHGSPISHVVENLLRLHQICRDFGIPKIVGMFLNPNHNQEFNQVYEVSSQHDIEFCEFFFDLKPGDLYSDGLHLNHTGLSKLAEEISDIAKKTTSTKTRQ